MEAVEVSSGQTSHPTGGEGSEGASLPHSPGAEAFLVLSPLTAGQSTDDLALLLPNSGSVSDWFLAQGTPMSRHPLPAGYGLNATGGGTP